MLFTIRPVDPETYYRDAEAHLVALLDRGNEGTQGMENEPESIEYYELESDLRLDRSEEDDKSEYDSKTNALRDLIRDLVDLRKTQFGRPYPTRIFHMLIQHALFYKDVLFSALQRVNSVRYDDFWFITIDNTLASYTRLSDLLVSPFEVLRERHDAGLLREHQVQLAAYVHTRMLERLASVCELAFELAFELDMTEMPGEREPDNLEDGWKLRELAGMFFRDVKVSCYTLEKLVLKLRSERLEVLLLKYLEEDGGEVGSRVASAIHALNEQKEIYSNSQSKMLDLWSSRRCY
ncbi:hypothetical protein BJ508DRAFT_361411 [Ascobolus immersus RN42]|uniref:Uncharacterized protein n=1 Tax=Ascobolus immersus RN42 TaxID=1160509 RepID=A0A3N4IC74_ASCIM|nr:hypothetical protein BJ508DRAFT_361411 [Ascobolus immersus RN42]